MQEFLNMLWEFTGGNEDNFIQKVLKVCKVLKVKPLKTRRPAVPSKKMAYNLTFERPKKSCRVFPSPRQIQSYLRNGKRLRTATRRWKSTKNFMKRNNNMKRPDRDIKKIIWMKWRLLTFTKDATSLHNLKKPQRPLTVDITFFWGNSLIRWQERIEKTIAVLCQKCGKRSKKTLQGYLHTMIG